MKRRAKHRLLLVAALVHLLADVAFAGGAVLCVGSNDHVAIEVPHATEAACQPGTSAGGVVHAKAFTPADSEGCEDRPLHSEAEFASKSDEDLDAVQDLVATFDASLAIDAPSAPRSNPRARNESLSLHLRTLRTTVLII